jgi:RNA polymerase sigma-70 factor (ECF subfamily)
LVADPENVALRAWGDTTARVERADLSADSIEVRRRPAGGASTRLPIIGVAEALPMKARTNTEWLVALKADGAPQTAALSDLRAYLLRASRYALSRHRNVLRLAPSDLDQLAEDSAQDALSSLLEHLHEFRGESRFTTWAYKFAINAALVTARPSRSAAGQGRAGRAPRKSERRPLDPHHRALQGEMLASLREAIEAHLTPRQRQALMAVVFEGVG